MGYIGSNNNAKRSLSVNDKLIPNTKTITPELENEAVKKNTTDTAPNPPNPNSSQPGHDHFREASDAAKTGPSKLQDPA